MSVNTQNDSSLKKLILFKMQLNILYEKAKIQCSLSLSLSLSLSSN